MSIKQNGHAMLSYSGEHRDRVLEIFGSAVSQWGDTNSLVDRRGPEDCVKVLRQHGLDDLVMVSPC